MAAVIIPVYTPVLDATVVSPAAIDVDAARDFLRGMDFELGGDVSILMAGTRTLMPLYVANNEEATR